MFCGAKNTDCLPKMGFLHENGRAELRGAADGIDKHTRGGLERGLGGFSGLKRMKYGARENPFSSAKSAKSAVQSSQCLL